MILLFAGLRSGDSGQRSLVGEEQRSPVGRREFISGSRRELLRFLVQFRIVAGVLVPRRRRERQRPRVSLFVKQREKGNLLICCFCSREERRWIEKQNKAERARRKKEEMSRLRSLVDAAYACDPRILRFKEEDKQKKLDDKKAKQDAVRARKEEEERVCAVLLPT